MRSRVGGRCRECELTEYELEDLGEEICSSCGRCDSCCSCDGFDADELGLDPEDDCGKDA